MSTARSRGLWIAAAVLLVATIAFYLVEPVDRSQPAQREASAELETAITRAETYYEFGHFDRAAETYRLAIERGMDDGEQWYRYAYSLEIAHGIDTEAYLRAYSLLLEQAPDHEYIADIDGALAEHSVAFDYETAAERELAPDTLVRFSGTISRITRGRVKSGTDTLFIATRPDGWLGHVGDEVRVEASRSRRHEAGETVTVVGRYTGWCTEDDDGVGSRDYPCVSASVVRPGTGE
ncbi:MAG: hypothetical protein ACOC2N_02845 [Spirochaetota bacterium]